MSKERELLKRFIAELKTEEDVVSLFNDIKECLAQPEQEPVANMSINQVLDHIKRKDLKKVFIIGIDEDDKLITRTSKMNFSEAVYFLELAKFSLLEHSNE